jgi:hypothetical protein
MCRDEAYGSPGRPRRILPECRAPRANGKPNAQAILAAATTARAAGRTALSTRTRRRPQVDLLGLSATYVFCLCGGIIGRCPLFIALTVRGGASLEPRTTRERVQDAQHADRCQHRAVEMVAGPLSGQSVVNEVKAIDQALVVLPPSRRRNAGSGAWHSRASVAPGDPTAKRTRCWSARRSKSGHHLNRSGRRIAVELMRRPFFWPEGGRLQPPARAGRPMGCEHRVSVQ